MSLLDAIILGIIQGLTEFLPVSSSGHLKLFEYLLGYKDLQRFIIFDLACHLGTLLSILVIFRKELLQALSPRSPRFWQVALATLPLVPLVILMKPIKAAYNSPELLGYFFLATALLLWAGTRFGWNAPAPLLQHRRWRDALTIGFSQAAAIFPGVSRSGTTITAGRLLGWNAREAVTFSFLLAIPAILGATAYELIGIWKKQETLLFAEIGWLPFLLGIATSFIVGCAALRLLMKVAAKNNFVYFSWYCAVIGLTLIVYFNFI